MMEYLWSLKENNNNSLPIFKSPASTKHVL